MLRAGGVRQTVELIVSLPERAAGANFLGRGLRRSDGLDGTDALGLASRADLPELRRVFVVGIDDDSANARSDLPELRQARARP